VSEPIRRKVLIFRNELLPASETFVLAQARALRQFEPIFAGVHPAQRSLDLGAEPIFASPHCTTLGKVMRRVFWHTGFSRTLYLELEKLQPDLIHAHFALDGAAALPIHNLLQIPLIVTLHGYDVSSSDAVLKRSKEGRVYLRKREQLWESASTFLCISDFIREKAIAAGFPEHKLRVLYTGTDMKMFQPEKSPRDPNMILFVGRFVEKKGCSYLLDAMAEIRKVRAARLVLIGGGPLEEMLRQRVAAEGLPCEFLGVQPAHVVKQQMAKARVFCVPSVTAATGDSEGLGMVFAEAQAMGTPVASFRHGGIAEVVRHGATGLLAPERDSHALAENILELLRNDALWTRYSGRGMQWARTRFDIATQTRELEAVYREVLLPQETACEVCA
jgi:colanic acid/amylovoran biosynthesis glycosyltransferase